MKPPSPPPPPLSQQRHSAMVSARVQPELLLSCVGCGNSRERFGSQLCRRCWLDNWAAAIDTGRQMQDVVALRLARGKETLPQVTLSLDQPRPLGPDQGGQGYGRSGGGGGGRKPRKRGPSKLRSHWDAITGHSDEAVPEGLLKPRRRVAHPPSEPSAARRRFARPWGAVVDSTEVPATEILVDKAVLGSTSRRFNLAHTGRHRGLAALLPLPMAVSQTERVQRPQQVGRQHAHRDGVDLSMTALWSKRPLQVVLEGNKKAMCSLGGSVLPIAGGQYAAAFRESRRRFGVHAEPSGEGFEPPLRQGTPRLLKRAGLRCLLRITPAFRLPWLCIAEAGHPPVQPRPPPKRSDDNGSKKRQRQQRRPVKVAEAANLIVRGHWDGRFDHENFGWTMDGRPDGEPDNDLDLVLSRGGLEELGIQLPQL